MKHSRPPMQQVGHPAHNMPPSDHDGDEIKHKLPPKGHPNPMSMNSDNDGDEY